MVYKVRSKITSFVLGGLVCMWSMQICLQVYACMSVAMHVEAREWQWVSPLVLFIYFLRLDLSLDVELNY